KLAHLGQIARRRDDDAGLRLYWFDHERDGARPARARERIGIAEIDQLEARRERAEVFAVLRLAREADDGRRAPMEVVSANDDLRLVVRHAFNAIAPLARELDCSL